MPVKIAIERKFREDPFPEGLRAISEIKLKAMEQKGYISGETLIDLEDNRRIVVISVWSSLVDWKTWLDSEERHRLENELTPYLQEPLNISLFMMGAAGMAKAFRNFSYKSAVAL